MKSHGFWLPVVLCGALLSATAWSKDDGDYDFSWLDPDKKIYVLQNRRYEKAGHTLISLMGGLGLSNAYRNVRFLEPRVSWYFTEEWGLELFYNAGFFSENSTFVALKDATANAIPVVREIKSQVGALAQWAPWYAKINVFNKILYFDWMFSAGGAVLLTEVDTRAKSTDPSLVEKQSIKALLFGTGHQYHVTEKFKVRLDFMGAFFKAPLYGNRGEQTWFTNYQFSVGAGYRL